MFVFNRFMTKYYPEYFQLSGNDKDDFKQKHQEEMEPLFQKMLYKHILNIEIKNESNLERYDELVKDDILLEFNKQTTYLRGFGDNFFYLNEFFAENEYTQSFETLYDYDYDNHEFQEKAAIEDDNLKDKTDKDIYTMRLHFYWARAIINNEFTYLCLSSPGIYLHSKIEESLQEYIEELIPHDYTEGDNYGELNDGFFALDYRLDANGKEKELENLTDFYNYRLNNKIFNELKDYFYENKNNKIWIEKSNNANNTDPNINYIFSDIDVIKNIRFKHWQKDTEKYITEDLSILEDIHDIYTKKYKNEILKIYNKIIEGTYVSDIKKNKKLKVVATSEFMNDLNKIIDDD
jgi:hypothetical protein